MPTLFAQSLSNHAFSTGIVICAFTCYIQLSTALHSCVIFYKYVSFHYTTLQS